MLELGDQAPMLHRGLGEALADAGIDLVYCCNPLMHGLWEMLPSSMQGGYADTAARLESCVLENVRAGDAIMVKGSHGSQMTLIVKALQRRFSRNFPASS
jgi:UDP-N-acetylmuramoyl-tripeptide--D-alanyl-D-alanine ligase